MRRLALLLAALLAALLAGSALASTPEFDRAQELRRAAREADQKGDLAAAAAALEEALTLRPNHPGMTLSLASVDARLGKTDAALDLLEAYAAMDLTAPIGEVPDFAALKGEARFDAVLARVAGNAAPVGEPQPIATLGDGKALFEAVAYDPATGRIFSGSVRQSRIVVVENGTARDFGPPGSGLWSVYGLAIDAERGLLWAASAAGPQTEGVDAAQHGAAGLFAFDLATGELKLKAVLPPDGKAVFGDLTVAADGTVYVSDSVNPQIWRLAPGGDALEAFVSDQRFVSLQGLTLNAAGTKLAIADYAMGLFVIDLETRAVTALATPEHTSLLGVDELTGTGPLVATQNGISPQRVIEIALDDSWTAIQHVAVVSANGPNTDLSLGTIVDGGFYYIPNAQWARFKDVGTIDGDAPFVPTEVVRVPLPTR